MKWFRSLRAKAPGQLMIAPEPSGHTDPDHTDDRSSDLDSDTYPIAQRRIPWAQDFASWYSLAHPTDTPDRHTSTSSFSSVHHHNHNTADHPTSSNPSTASGHDRRVDLAVAFAELPHYSPEDQYRVLIQLDQHLDTYKVKLCDCCHFELEVWGKTKYGWHLSPTLNSKLRGRNLACLERFEDDWTEDELLQVRGRGIVHRHHAGPDPTEQNRNANPSNPSGADTRKSRSRAANPTATLKTEQSNETRKLEKTQKTQKTHKSHEGKSREAPPKVDDRHRVRPTTSAVATGKTEAAKKSTRHKPTEFTDKSDGGARRQPTTFVESKRSTKAAAPEKREEGNSTESAENFDVGALRLPAVHSGPTAKAKESAQTPETKNPRNSQAGDRTEESDDGELLLSTAYSEPAVEAKQSTQVKFKETDCAEDSDDEGLLLPTVYTGPTDKASEPTECAEDSDDDGLLLPTVYTGPTDKASKPTDCAEDSDDDGLLLPTVYTGPTDKASEPTECAEDSDDDGLLLPTVYTAPTDKASEPTKCAEDSDDDGLLLPTVYTGPTCTASNPVEARDSEDCEKHQSGEAAEKPDDGGFLPIVYSGPVVEARQSVKAEKTETNRQSRSGESTHELDISGLLQATVFSARLFKSSQSVDSSASDKSGATRFTPPTVEADSAHAAKPESLQSTSSAGPSVKTDHRAVTRKSSKSHQSERISPANIQYIQQVAEIYHLLVLEQKEKVDRVCRWLLSQLGDGQRSTVEKDEEKDGHHTHSDRSCQSSSRPEVWHSVNLYENIAVYYEGSDVESVQVGEGPVRSEPPSQLQPPLRLHPHPARKPEPVKLKSCLKSTPSAKFQSAKMASSQSA
ncbi:MAG: hypothetical protein M1826_007628 [Phylliscum demangeonii]|nr:MAG: hypothetical protein M1826_007628 [Phylliscum demangeonii]